MFVLRVSEVEINIFKFNMYQITFKAFENFTVIRFLYNDQFGISHSFYLFFKSTVQKYGVMRRLTIPISSEFDRVLSPIIRTRQN